MNMTKRLLSLATALMLGAVALRAGAQAPLPTADQVLDKYVKAIGGAAAFEKLTSRLVTASLELPDAGINGSIQITEKAPNKSFALVELGPAGSMREGTDGVVAWDDNPMTGLREKAGEELAEALRGAIFNQEVKMKSIYKTLQVTGREAVSGRPAVAVLGTPAEGSPVKMFFDEESGLMVKQSSTRQSPQGPIDFDVYLESYRDIDGIKQPYLIRQVTAQMTVVIRISEIKHNVPVDDAIFKKPGMPVR